MASIITNYGKSLAIDVFKDSITKYILIGSSSKNDEYLYKLLSSNDKIIKEFNINSDSSTLFRYFISEPKNISDSMIDKERNLIFNIGIKPNELPSRKYVYAVCLLDKDGNIYSIDIFSEPFNSIKDGANIITIKHSIMSGENLEQNLSILNDADGYITRNEFVNWANNHTHFDENVSVKIFKDAISKLEYNKVDKEYIGDLQKVNSMDNSSLVNILNEVISSIGMVPRLATKDQDNLVNAINELVELVGDRRDLKFVTKNIVDAMNKVFDLSNNKEKDPEFKDEIKLKDVNWRDKVDYNVIGNFDNFKGKDKTDIISMINEARVPDITLISGDYSFNRIYNCGDTCYIWINRFTNEIELQKPNNPLPYLWKRVLIHSMKDENLEEPSLETLFTDWFIDDGLEVGHIVMDSVDRSSMPGYLMLNNKTPNNALKFSRYPRVKLMMDLAKATEPNSVWGPFKKINNDDFCFSKDIRGYFPRVWSNGNNIDVNRDFNSLQECGLPNISVIVTGWRNRIAGSAAANSAVVGMTVGGSGGYSASNVSRCYKVGWPEVTPYNFNINLFVKV